MRSRTTRPPWSDRVRASPPVSPSRSPRSSPMSDAPEPIERTPQWWALASHQAEIADLHLRELFASDPGRGERFNLEVGDLYVDYAKHRLTDDTLALLFDLARAARVTELRDAMFAGE